MVCLLLMCGFSVFVSGILIVIILSMYIYLLALLSMRWRRFIGEWVFLVVLGQWM